MNKNLFNTFAIAAMAVLAGACAKEQVGSADGETVEMTFNVDVPETTITTKGLSDAAQVNELICQVFLRDGNYTPVPDLNQTVEVKNKKAKATFNLVKGQKYSFAFWAQVKGTGYYDTGDLRAVKMNVGAVKANDPAMDAYFAQKDFTALSTPVTDITKNTVTLYRAVAQVNFGTINSNRADKLEVVKSKIKLTEVPTVFDVVRGNMDDAYSVPATIEFKENVPVKEKLLVAGNEYDYLSTCYVFAYKDQKLTDATATFWVGSTDRKVSVPNAPYKRNMRTNILGDLLTINQDFNIVVDPDFKGGDQTYDAVKANLEAGKEVTLSEDYFVADKSKGVTLDVGVTSVLNLNGKKFSNENRLEENKAALQVHGDLTINGDGEVYCEGGANNNAIIVEQGGHLVINGGTYNVGANTNSGKSNATIFVMGPDKYGKNGSVEINGGVFMAEAGSDSDATPTTPFVLNQHDDITVNCFSVKGGTFVGFNPASVNEAKGAITSFVADGYKSVETTYNDKPAWKVVDASVSVSGQSELETTLNTVAKGESVYMKLADGEYSLYGKTVAADKDLSIAFIGNGADKTSFKVGKETVENDYGTDYSLKGASATFKKMKIVSTNGAYKGFAHAKELYFEDCTLVGQFAYMGLKASFKNCQFIQESANAYNLQTYTADEYVFDNCTFKASGKFLYTFREKTTSSYKVTFNNCHFIALAGATTKSAVSLKTDSYPSDGGAKYYVYFNKTDATDDVLVGELTGSRLYSSDLGYNAETKTNTRETQAVVFVDTKKVWENGAKVE